MKDTQLDQTKYYRVEVLRKGEKTWCINSGGDERESKKEIALAALKYYRLKYPENKYRIILVTRTETLVND